MIKCNYCGSIKNENFILIKDRFSFENFQYIKCSQCGLIFLENIPSETEILRYYPKNYEAYNTEGDHKVLEKKIKFIHSFHKKCSSILDIGCSTGSFLVVAKENGIEHVFGVELNTDVAETASQRGVEILGDTLEDAVYTSKTFDVITLWDVFEHLPNPIIALKKIHSMLNKNGYLFMSVPNLDSFDRYIFRNYWIGWDAPRHFYLYKQKLLKSLLNQSGFDYQVSHCITGSKGAFNLSVDNLFNRPLSNSRLFSFISMLLWPYRKLGYVFNKCPVITVVARKLDQW